MRKEVYRMAMEITKDNFEQEVLKSNKPVLVDFWAAWCGPCKMIAPTIEEIAAERDDIVVGKIDVDAQGELAQKYGVMSIPTLMVFKGGEVASKAVGVQPKAKILEML